MLYHVRWLCWSPELNSITCSLDTGKAGVRGVTQLPSGQVEGRRGEPSVADSLSRVPNPGVCTWPDAVHVGKASCPQPQPPTPHHLQPYRAVLTS